MTLMKPCPECGGKPMLCVPNYADENGTMVVCEVCDFAGDSFVLGEYGEGRDRAMEDWNKIPRGPRVIEEYTGYKMISEFYGDKTAKRSGVMLIQHIKEGCEILRRIGSDMVVMEAYCVHPIFQADDDLKANFAQCDDLHPLVALYAMEYRSVANDFLSDQVEKGPDAWGRETIYPRKPLRLSPLQAVNEMLIADKVQNRKDFELYHKATHARSDELDFYFKHWLKALHISEDHYQRLIEGL